jgi:3-deoxy-D-manno-octulosonic-acid transferase
VFFVAFFYYTLCVIVFGLAIFFLLYKTRTKKYINSIPARFFLKNNAKFKSNKIHFHLCSLGEVNALTPIIANLSKTIKNSNINISTITNTGYESALKLSNVNVRYLPFEIFLPFWLTKQKLLVVFEAELWFMLFYIYKQFLKTPTILLNARISKKSFNSYKRFKFFYKFIFKNIDLVLAQSKQDKKRLKMLGAKNIKIVGNIKFIFKPNIKNLFIKEVSKINKIIVGASTHKGEEQIILNSFLFANLNLKNAKSKNKLILVPRHPERFAQVDKLTQKFAKIHNFTYHKYSKQKNLNSDIVLVDELGVLVELYKISDITILCGSFVDGIGGHNFVECAYFNNIILSGKYIFNQISVVKELENIYLINKEKLNDKLKQAINQKLKPSFIPKNNNQADIKQITNIISHYAKSL